MLFITSQAVLNDSASAPTGEDDRSVVGWYEERTSSGVQITVSRADGVKCDRCWRYVPAVSPEPGGARICDRCSNSLAEPVGPIRS